MMKKVIVVLFVSILLVQLAVCQGTTGTPTTVEMETATAGGATDAGGEGTTNPPDAGTGTTKMMTTSGCTQVTSALALLVSSCLMVLFTRQ